MTPPDVDRCVAVLENLRLRIEMGGDISSDLKRPERMEAIDAAIRALRQGGGWLTARQYRAVKAAMDNAEHDAGDFDDADEDAANARDLYEGLQKLLPPSPAKEG